MDYNRKVHGDSGSVNHHSDTRNWFGDRPENRSRLDSWSSLNTLNTTHSSIRVRKSTASPLCLLPSLSLTLFFSPSPSHFLFLILSFFICVCMCDSSFRYFPNFPINLWIYYCQIFHYVSTHRKDMWISWMTLNTKITGKMFSTQSLYSNIYLHSTLNSKFYRKF